MLISMNGIWQMIPGSAKKLQRHSAGVVVVDNKSQLNETLM